MPVTTIAELRAYDVAHREQRGTKPDEKLFLYSLACALKVKSVLELGCGAGHATCWLALALLHLDGGGRVTAVDDWSHRWGGAASVDAIRLRLHDTGFDALVEVVTADSLEYVRAHETNSYDMVFVDAGHDYAHVRPDLVEAIRVGHRVVVAHDACHRDTPGVRRACVELGGVLLPIRRGFGLWGIDPAEAESLAED